MSNPNAQHPKAWYRQFWPWFVIAIPLISIILSFVMLYVAIHGKESMVVDNYYKEGRAINQELSKDQFAQELELGAELLIQPNGDVRVQLQAARQIAPDYLVLKLFHPTLNEKDQQIRLQPEGQLAYSGHLQGDLQGRWYIDLMDDQDLWRLKGQTWLPRDTDLKLGALSP